MTDDLRWAVRYAFLEDLWRDRNRVIVDAGLEAALREGPGDESLEALVDALVPRTPKARTWMAVADEAVARELAQTRPGTGFLPRASFADVVAHRDWAVALVELSALDEHSPGGRRLREQLVERVQEGRTVLVCARAAPPADSPAPEQDEPEEDAGYAALSELLDESLGGGRIFGLFLPPMAAMVDFGGDEEAEDEEESEDADVPLSFDNTLGTEAPTFVEYVAVAGEHPPLPEGMTLVELPARASASPEADDPGLRTRLLSAQRQVELAAIDRQALLEKVDALESAQERLEQQASSLRDELARAVTEPVTSGTDEQLQAALADNQALRWKVQQLERELDQARARPVEALEAEVAALRAELEAQSEKAAEAEAKPEATEPEPAAQTPEPEPNAQTPEPDAASDAAAELESAVALPLGIELDERLAGQALDATDQAERLRFGAALAELDRLIVQVERGGIGVLPLRQALVELRRRLRA